MATSPQIKQLIETSSVLSEAERKEWLDLLPYMNDKQQSELLLILQPNTPSDSMGSGGTPPSLPPVQPAPSPVSAQVSVPISPIAPPSQTTAPVSAVSPMQPAVATTVSAFLSKNFASELHRGSMPGTFKPESSAPLDNLHTVQLPPVSFPLKSVTDTPPLVQQVVKPNVGLPSFGTLQQQKTPSSIEQSDVSEIMKELAVLDVPPAHDEPVVHARSLEAVRMLNVATLRGSGVVNVESELKVLCEKFGYFSVQFAFEQSPLYQAYVAVGARILKEHHTFEEVQAALAAAGRPYLTKPEFEEFSDLIRRLKGHP